MTFARSLVALGPAENDRTAALRVGLGVAVPTLLLLVLGHPQLTVYAVFGAFTGMYGRNEPHRLRHQLRAMLLLVCGVALGVGAATLGVTSWSLVLLECGFAFAGSVFADRSGLRPAGPFFGLFALGACASIPPLVPPVLAIAVAAGSAAVGLLLGAVGRPRQRLGAESPPVSWRRALAYLAAVGVAGSLSTLSGLGHPIWAMAAAAVPLAVTGTANRMRRGAHRILGTLVGLLLTATILVPFGTPAPAILVLLVIALQFPTELFMSRNYGLALVFFTPLILLMTQLAHPIDEVALIVDRALQTTIGALVGIVVVAVGSWWPQRRDGGS
ncbi:FUSC family protein [Microbacteriaceae bacterium VKM Ac-2854]|nr:FUSC family protein [Microbacteriaceae bacterium VKM Ac-2854]